MEFENGRILNSRFAKYRVPRFQDMPPEMEALLIDRTDQPPVGAGEAPILGIAPAIANAIFALTQMPLHTMPIGPALAARGYRLS